MSKFVYENRIIFKKTVALRTNGKYFSYPEYMYHNFILFEIFVSKYFRINSILCNVSTLLLKYTNSE